MRPIIDELIEKSNDFIDGSFYCCCFKARQKLERAKLLIDFSPEQNELIAEAEEILNKHY